MALSSTQARPGAGAQGPDWRRMGCLVAGFVAVTCVALVVTAAVILVRRWEAPPPPPPPTLSAKQLQQLKPLDGTWEDDAGSEIIFTEPDIVNGLPAGKVTFLNVPDLYSWQWGTAPPSSDPGHWTVTTSTVRGGGLLFWFDGPPFGEYAETVGFKVEGSVSNPVLVCQYPDGGHACTYARLP